MASPAPPVALKDQCSIIHDNILYVYSPDAFQILPLTKNATWTQEPNGVSVTGAVCVKGGVDGDNNNPALYVVGGVTNSSTSGYSGIQRYSIQKKSWETINPISAVTANRQDHGATYLNASSAILVYGGSQNGDAGPSTETFLMLMYPPYRVQAYSSAAPAVKRPFLLGFTEDKALMVGGGNDNQKVFTFHPDPGWVDLGVALPVALPDPSVAQVNVQALADGTRILQTYFTNESPTRVTRNVLTNPGFVPAPYGQTIGDSTPGGNSRLFRRQLIQGNYPTYNGTGAPNQARTGASLASNSQLVAIVGGDSNSTVAVFNSTANTWIDPQAFFGDTQKPLTTAASATPTPTESHTLAATSAASTTPAVASSRDSQSNGLAVLGGILGGICGLATILIILLLWLRSIKRRKRSEAAAAKKKQSNPSLPNDKAQGLAVEEDGGLKPLAQQAQPMGRSPVPSAVISEADSMAMFGGRHNEKGVEAQAVPSHARSKLNPHHAANNSVGGFFKSNNKTPLAISRPMMPNLGDYQERPSIDLGKATPSVAPVLPPLAVAVSSQQKADQRKTDEGWAKYFQADRDDDKKDVDNPYAVSYEDDPRRSTSRPSTAKGGSAGFWPGSGVPSSTRPAKLPLRDSTGNLLNHAMVASASPSLEVGHADPSTRNLSVAEPARAHISSADSISTDRSSDDGYEDDDMDAYSDTHSSYHQGQWNPMGNTWSGPSQRQLRPPSVRVGASAFPPPTSHSGETENTSSSGNSSIPTFPLPASAIGRADTTDQYIGTTTVERPPTNPFSSKNPYMHTRKSSNTYDGGRAPPDFFGPSERASSSRADSGKIPDSTDMSWLNLGTPAGITDVHGSPHSRDSRDPA